jgi:hypothetical protein
MLRHLAPFLTETVMGFLALAALGTGLAPLLFPLSSSVGVILEGIQWLIVALFALEYAVYRWPNRRRGPGRRRTRSQRPPAETADFLCPLPRTCYRSCKRRACQLLGHPSPQLKLVRPPITASRGGRVVRRRGRPRLGILVACERLGDQPRPSGAVLGIFPLLVHDTAGGGGREQTLSDRL